MKIAEGNGSGKRIVSGQVENCENKDVNGMITDISRCSLHDGPGVRTVVYFKGCGLRCKWCHNPETLHSETDIMYLETKCIKCGRCVEFCPECHKVSDGKMVLVRENCVRCGRCADICPASALQSIGRPVSVEELLGEIKKDIHFFRQSGGGVTLSGGECLLQSEFAAALLKKCKEEGIHTAIETALFVPWENIERVLPFVDLIYADLKIADGEKHRTYTGQLNGQIISNLHRLSETVTVPVTVRIPLIPGVNDTEEEITALGRIIGTLGSAVKTVEVLKYNYLAESKYEGIGAHWESFGKENQSEEKLSDIRRMLQVLTKCEVI